jgi:uncharacterized protein YbjT (DUF2867 family)
MFKPKPKPPPIAEPTPAPFGDAPFVAVFGATGRTGQLVVQELLAQGFNVKALVRNESKATTVLLKAPGFNDKVSSELFDLGTASEDEIVKACKGAQKVIWCASGFTEDGKSIDIKGMTALSKAFDAEKPDGPVPPRVVMLSSAGVTRPSWGPYRQEVLVKSFDIPIINLNPFQILNRKAEAEELLRQSGVPYSIVRPTGLKFEGWPSGRPILSQGDVAVGRANAKDVAKLLVDILDEPTATSKTFEMFTLKGYPAPRSIASLLEPLKRDDEGPLDPAQQIATYKLLQQLLPGEEQDATKLEMGRTYEQVDSGEVARERGAAPTEREKNLASGVRA